MNITGQFGLDQSFSMLENTPTLNPINFDCQLNTLSMPNTSLCYPYTGEKKGDVLREKPELVSENELRPIGDLSRSIIPQNPTFILIFKNISYPLFNDSSRSPVMTERIGPWTYIEGTDDANSIRVTAYSTNFGTKTFFTHLSSAADGPEPNILWDNGVRGYNTDLMRRQLVASPNSPSLRDRGLLSMQPRPEWRNARDNAIVG
ncbi:hypothetical protein F4821DRAFT_233972 [Hypoxylon rubiginosum]|uniref:Uncharacterized protein n=1 Tax=Hypoxylon rubiginosum TaxID=110542 RepID=A0ACC0D716_9PEZI|nr:hypothetical protein F4821DRAFT_233972 [Hypoxylon rubiginosum]